MEPVITIPRLERETVRAYAARVAYLTMGAGRSLERLRGQSGGGSGVSTRLNTLELWSSRYAWAEHARRYDEHLAALAAQAHAAAYRQELERHRGDAMAYGKALCGVAAEMLVELRQMAKTLEYTPATLATIARALTIGLDLQAHALRLSDLLPRLVEYEPSDDGGS